MPHLSLAQWIWAVVGAVCIGMSKSGFSGVGLVTVIVMASLFPPRESTGVLLPMLIFGDICSVAAFRRHALWPQIWRMLPPTIAGVVAGFFLMGCIPDARFGPVIGWTVLVMVVLQAVRQFRPTLYGNVPHTHGFALLMGLWSGVATMLANAAGPVMALYLLAINLPKYELVGTSAWFFLIINILKVPFSAKLGLIHGGSLLFNFTLLPAIVFGILLGRRLIAVVPQKLFESLLLIFAAIAALKLTGIFWAGS